MRVILVSLIFVLTIYGQEKKEIETYLNLANSFYESKDYLFAAKLFKLIETTSQDSLIAAEALYKLISTGEKAAQEYKKRFYLKDRLSSINKIQIWNDYFQKDYEKSLQLFKDIGFEISCDTIYPWKYYDIECWCNTSKYYKRLISVYKNTIWAERILFENIKRMESDDDYIEDDILKTSLEFLKKYPNSSYLFNLNLIIAQCYSDIWNDNKLEKARKKSIEYYNKVIKDSKFTDFPESTREFIMKQYKLLKDKKNTRFIFYGRC